MVILPHVAVTNLGSGLVVRVRNFVNTNSDRSVCQGEAKHEDKVKGFRTQELKRLEANNVINSFGIAVGIDESSLKRLVIRCIVMPGVFADRKHTRRNVKSH